MSKETPQQRLDKKMKEAKEKTKMWSLGVSWDEIEKTKKLCKTGNRGVDKR